VFLIGNTITVTLQSISFNQRIYEDISSTGAKEEES